MSTDLHLTITIELIRRSAALRELADERYESCTNGELQAELQIRREQAIDALDYIVQLGSLDRPLPLVIPDCGEMLPVDTFITEMYGSVEGGG